SRSWAGLSRARARQVAQGQIFRGIDRLLDQVFLDHRIDRLLNGRGRHAAIGVAIIVAWSCKIAVEHLFRRLRESRDKLDRFAAIGLVIIPIESGNVIREKPTPSILFLFQKFRASALKNHGCRADRTTAGEQRPQVALAAFDRKEGDNKYSTIDA